MTATSAPYTTHPSGAPPRESVGDVADATVRDPQTLAVANAALRGGFVLLPRTLLHAPGLSRDAKLLYAVLLSYAWQHGSCFPGSERLQADLGCGKNQVTRYMQELERTGLITRRRRGLGKTTVYTLHDPPAPQASPHGQAAGPPSGGSRQEGDQSPRSGETRVPAPGRPESPIWGNRAPRSGEQNKTQGKETQENINQQQWGPRRYRPIHEPRWRPPPPTPRNPPAPLMMMFLSSCSRRE